MRVVVVSVVGDADELRLALVEAPFGFTALLSPRGDRLCTAARALAAKCRKPFTELPALDDPGGVENLWTSGGEALVVLTDGASYALAEVARRARVRGWPVHVRETPWTQGELW